MTETERRIDCVMIALSAIRRKGMIAADARVSPRGMAYLSREIEEPVSAATFHRIENRARTLAKLALEAHYQAHYQTLKS